MANNKSNSIEVAKQYVIGNEELDGTHKELVKTSGGMIGSQSHRPENLRHAKNTNQSQPTHSKVGVDGEMSSFQNRYATSSTASSTRSSSRGEDDSAVKFMPSIPEVATTTRRITRTAGRGDDPPSASTDSTSSSSASSLSGEEGRSKSVTEWKEEGNRAYTGKRYREALEAYDEGLQRLSEKKDQDLDFYTTQASLLSNRAMALIKLEDYRAAEESCTRVLEQQDQYESILKQQQQQASSSESGNLQRASVSVSNLRLYKVWFRRAVARENRAKDVNVQKQEPLLIQDLIHSAKADLQASLQWLEQDDSISEKERFGTKKTIAEAAQRIQRLLHQIKQDKQPIPPRNDEHTYQKHNLALQQTKQIPRPSTTNGGGVSTKHPSRKTVPPRSSSGSGPSTAQVSRSPDGPNQRHAVLRLLKGRLPKQQTTQSAAATPAAQHGEAFFLVDWQWWCKFCFHVELVHPTGKEPQQHGLVSYLPKGATLPTSPTTSNENEEEMNKKATGKNKVTAHPSPGPIDNSNLFLVPPSSMPLGSSSGAVRTTQQVFVEQWYMHAAPANNQKEGKPKSLPPPLQPNLVRGYHYELIPREVYKALREWYTETTPSICRRATRNVRTGHVSIPIYLGPEPATEATRNVETKYCGACHAPLHVNLRCTRCSMVHYCDRGCQENHWPLHKATCRVLSKQDNSTAVARKFAELSYGRVGLNNLGNTCFMNAALQCLSHATPLTRHFLSGKFKQDLNKSNPLGTGGKLAVAYETVMKDLWTKTSVRSTSPNALKRAISQFAPRFAGFLQHDAQEFLAYLLDGLHEDVNRIRKAPYVEMPDVDGDQDMAVAGALAWDSHKRRNDSLVMDSFYGQFKSSCICPQCNRVSVSFDAFNHVSLEIPQQQTAIVTLGIFVIKACNPSQGILGSCPTRYAVHVRRNNPISEVIRELSKLTGIPSSKLHLSECQEHEIVRIAQRQEMVSTLNVSNLLVAYEAASLDDDDGAGNHKPVIHGILCHKVVDSKQGDDDAGERERPNSSTAIGIPLLVSWSADWSCREVWEYLWHLVEDKVEEEVRQQYKDAIEFRLLDARGKGMTVFPDLVGPQQDGAVSKMTSILPRQSEETLVRFVGENALEDFVFLHVEWRNLAEDKTGPEAVNATLDLDRFVFFNNHSSWQDSTAKRRAQNNRKGGVSLDQCFETFVKPERLDERNMWYCSKCKEHVRAMKTMELWRLPNILVVHLKRFEFKNVVRRDKLETLVNFPLDGLDMGTHCARHGNGQESFVEDSVPAMYDLFAVVNHYGRMGFGHYTAFARNWNEREISKEWQLFDDSTVKSVGESGDSVVSSAAYVLFYRRRVWN